MTTRVKSTAEPLASGDPLASERKELRKRLAEAERRADRSEMALREVEETNRILQEQLHKAHKMQAIGTLAGGIAHDFNNMLGAILGYTSLLKNRMKETHPYFKAVDTIERSAQRAAELSGKLVGFARGGKYRTEPVALNDVVERVLPIVRGTFHKSIVIETSLSEGLPPIEGDIGQLEHSLLNLCLNARDAMQSGGTLCIETSRETIGDSFLALHPWAVPGDFVRLAVVDTGRGIPRETRKKIFEPYFTTRGTEKGTDAGKGLSMVFRAVKNHGGFIEVHSDSGKGSTLRLYLPVSWRVSSDSLSVETAHPPGKVGKILVVDDEPSIRDMASAILLSAGYEVVSARTGEEACELLRSEGSSVSLALLDIEMPGMGGKRTFRTIRKICPGLPVVVSTGHGIEGTASEILQMGASRYLGKPYRRGDLLQAVRGALSK
jgi:two-component system cell cycle sensor histidine kinase/response regulator CckA